MGPFAACLHRPPTRRRSHSRPLGCEKGDHRGDLAGIARPTEWDAETLLLVGILVLLSGHRSSDLARRDGVRGDLVLAQLESEGLDQSADAVLGGVVRAGSDSRLMLVDAGDRNAGRRCPL